MNGNLISKTIKPTNYILFLFILFKQALYAQTSTSFKHNFEYIMTEKDTVCNKFYLIVNNLDTINLIDKNGLKQGIWNEPFLVNNVITASSSDYKYFNPDKHNDSFNISYFKINSTIEYKINNYILNHANVKINYFEDLSCSDNVLLINNRDLIKQDCFYLEKYWFGYLFGKYKNNIRIGIWEFIPIITSNKINYFMVFENINPYNSSKNITYSISTIQGDQIGKYLNNKREGTWHSKKVNSNNSKPFILEYKNNELQCYLYYINEQLDTFFYITFKNNKKYIVGKSKLEIDISYIPYTFRGVGERYYFDNLILFKEE